MQIISAPGTAIVCCAGKCDDKTLMPGNYFFPAKLFVIIRHNEFLQRTDSQPYRLFHTNTYCGCALLFFICDQLFGATIQGEGVVPA